MTPRDCRPGFITFSLRPSSAHAGFTLLEIVLVIVILSVITALVAPSVFPDRSTNVADETRRLQQVLRLAVDETQLTGVPLRWWGRVNSYGFEQWLDHRWQQAVGNLFATRKLNGVVIDRVVENGVDQQIEESSFDTSSGSNAEFADQPKHADTPLIGQIVILPNGMVTTVDIELVNRQGEERRHRLRVRSGPAGIAEENNEGKQ